MTKNKILENYVGSKNVLVVILLTLLLFLIVFLACIFSVSSKAQTNPEFDFGEVVYIKGLGKKDKLRVVDSLTKSKTISDMTDWGFFWMHRPYYSYRCYNSLGQEIFIEEFNLER